MTHCYKLTNERQSQKAKKRNSCVALVSCCVLNMSCGKGGPWSGGTCGCERAARGLQRAWESRAVHSVGRRQSEGEVGKDNIGEIMLLQ